MEALSTEQGLAAPARPGLFAYLKDRYVNVYPTGALRWWLMALIVWAWTIEQFEAQRVGPVLVYVLDDFGVTMTQWGEVAALSGVAYGVGALVLSRLGDRFGRRPMLIWPVLVYCAITVVAAVAPSFQVLSSMVILGMFTVAGMSPAVHAASRDISPRVGRAMAYSWVSLAYTGGALLSTVVAAWTLVHWPGWRPQFWIGAGFALFTAAGLAFFYRDLSPQVRSQIMSGTGQPEQAQPSSAPDAADPRAAAYYSGSLVYRSPRLWMLGGTLVFWTLAYVTVMVYAPTYLTQYFNVAPARAAELISYFWLTFSGSVMLSGWLSDRTQVRKTVTAFGGVATGACFFASGQLPPDAHYGTLALLWAMTGLGAGFIYPAWCAAFSETAERITPHGVARAFGISGTLVPVTGIVLNLGLPRVVATQGWPAWMNIAGGSCLCCAALICLAQGRWLPTRRKRAA